MINLWLALREDAVTAIAGWANLTPDQQLIREAVESHPDTEHISVSTKRDTFGGKQWELFSIYADDITAFMVAVEALFPTPNNALVLGAWQWDGLQLGTSRDDNGDVIGEPLYPPHPRTKNFMPDKVSYDADEVETGRTAATGPKQVNLMAGQEPRNFT